MGSDSRNKVLTTRKRNKAVLVITLAVCIAIIFYDQYHGSGIFSQAESTLRYSAYSNAINYNVNDVCKQLPAMRSGSFYFKDQKIAAGKSSEGITPSFQVGSYIADKVPYHMNGDRDMFTIVKELVNGKEGALALDIGANQGFYTYFLATLGMQVHSFEISSKNFQALQHGIEFNNKPVADRVHLYPIGLGENNARFGMQGADYTGFLKQGTTDGPIQGLAFDCFAYHMMQATSLDFTNVAFVKLDVEGFEIAVLKGAQNSLFRPGNSKIGGMLMEVGPGRWNRASVDFATGVEQMKKLADHFKTSYILIKTMGSYAKTCPTSLVEGVFPHGKKPSSEMETLQMFTVDMNDFEPLLARMKEKDYDCNFFFKN